MTPSDPSSSAFPLQDTAAATMLAAGLEQTTASRKISLRQLGKELGYKQAVALSHMAKGRIPIPIERVVQLSEALGFDQGTFLMAVLEQRYPMVRWADRLQPRLPDHSDGYSGRLAGVALADLEPDHRAIAEELVRDKHPKERWLSVPEVAVMSAIRSERPDVTESGLNLGEHARLKEILNRF